MTEMAPVPLAAPGAPAPTRIAQETATAAPAATSIADDSAGRASGEFAPLFALALLAVGPQEGAQAAAQALSPEAQTATAMPSAPAPGESAAAELAAISAAASLALALFAAPDDSADQAAAGAAAEGRGSDPLQPRSTVAAPLAAQPSTASLANPQAAGRADVSQDAAARPGKPDRSADPGPAREPATEPARAAAFNREPMAPAPEPAHRGAHVAAAPSSPPSAAARPAADAIAPHAPLRPGAAGFAEAFCARVQLEIGAGRAAATIEVSPPELGPVELRIRVADGVAHLACSAPHAAAREAIAEALPRLREMLAAQGLALGETSVGAELPGREQAAPRARADGAGESGARPRATDSERAPVSAPHVRRRGLLDVFA